MAKLKAPLMSLGASQQLGKALVFFPWKGLNVVREYVIPANPKTGSQTTHRARLTAAVAAIHAAQASTTNPIDATDVAACNLWASVVQAATTWFNQLVRSWVDQYVAGKLGAIYRGGSVAIASATSLNVALHGDRIEDGTVNAGNFKYGTSKTALINSWTAIFDGAPTLARCTITGLTTGVKYFVQFVPTATANYVGNKSGIYYGKPA